VIVNSSANEAEIKFENIAGNEKVTWYGFLTDKDHNLASMTLEGDRDIAVPARSIVTLTTQKP